ncbi:hotdog fold thioesterase [Flammeovirga pectinis]|uniref:Hotdog fold thioesterase n=1 Tax=Flammeovirga pectinis TaxID=2494373 RepID=A0A3S9P470_9BACT|nr:hotdog fold thioesterase [Flammeovirga pectinis]AZQ63006.1 hotdog fold thioesterase [Flammeovirga pectinis]
MFNSKITKKSLNDLRDNMLGHLDIEFISVEDGLIVATMPVDQRTKQPMGLLHGGASMVLAETLGSVGALTHAIDRETVPVGQEINANHIKSARNGIVTGFAKPIHIGKKSHVWEIKIYDDEDNLLCISRMTIALIRKK